MKRAGSILISLQFLLTSPSSTIFTFPGVTKEKTPGDYPAKETDSRPSLRTLQPPLFSPCSSFKSSKEFQAKAEDKFPGFLWLGLMAGSRTSVIKKLKEA